MREPPTIDALLARLAALRRRMDEIETPRRPGPPPGALAEQVAADYAHRLRDQISNPPRRTPDA